MNKTGDAKNSSRLKKRLLKRLATQLSIFTVATISAFMMFFLLVTFYSGSIRGNGRIDSINLRKT
ncbi:hypothetical protein DUI35_05110 [Enterococcus faecium]|uniref:hypothetical protein n=1 Tax=Enterococcus faecium TaxID=1352 RepID=UPI0019FE700B|nr:hypothetical protein [Enterococcus faecium]